MAKHSHTETDNRAEGPVVHSVPYGESMIPVHETAYAALVARGLRHFMGSEAASKVIAKVKAHIVLGTDRKQSDVSGDEVAAWKAAHETELAEIESAVEADFLARLESGQMVVERVASVRTTGTSRVEIRARALAWSAPVEIDGKPVPSLEAILAANGIKAPKKGEAITFPNGQSFTKDDLIDRRLEKAGEALRAVAKAQIEAEAQAKAEGKAQAAEVGLDLI